MGPLVRAGDTRVRRYKKFLESVNVTPNNKRRQQEKLASGVSIKLNHERGLDPARDQRGCSTPFGNPNNFVLAASCGVG